MKASVCLTTVCSSESITSGASASGPDASLICAGMFVSIELIRAVNWSSRLWDGLRRDLEGVYTSLAPFDGELSPTCSDFLGMESDASSNSGSKFSGVRGGKEKGDTRVLSCLSLEGVWRVLDVRNDGEESSSEGVLVRACIPFDLAEELDDGLALRRTVMFRNFVCQWILQRFGSWTHFAPRKHLNRRNRGLSESLLRPKDFSSSALYRRTGHILENCSLW